MFLALQELDSDSRGETPPLSLQQEALGPRGPRGPR